MRASPSFHHVSLLFYVLSMTVNVACSELLPSSPQVTLDNATFVGSATDATNTVHQFLGIPFAQRTSLTMRSIHDPYGAAEFFEALACIASAAPIGDLRYRLPQTIPPYNTLTHSATSFGSACFQQDIDLPLLTGYPADIVNTVINSIYGGLFNGSEDCLTLNVWKPAPSANVTSMLPVLVWIYGGAFETGASSTADGSSIVSGSVQKGQPIVFVSMNYRLSGLGFLASKEVKAAGVGNLGLQDQREALRWVQRYISAFGGDRTKVTIQGPSAGGISVALQMVTNGGDTEGLFRGAFMESGSPLPVGDISHGQVYYDQIVADVGCSSASDSLACLRTVSYANLTAAINKTPSMYSYQSLDFAFLPRVDGVFLTKPPFELVQSGSIASIPFVTGDCDDEGTSFTIANANVTTNAQFSDYVRAFYLPNGTAAQFARLEEFYPQNPTAGSPFDTGVLNAITPEFKRLAAFQGDWNFQGPRRWFLQHAAAQRNAWSFAYKRNKAVPILGTFHGSDVLNVFGGGDLAYFSIAFAAFQDPNAAGLGPVWPKWTSSSPVLMGFVDSLPPLKVLDDTFRTAPIDYLNSLALQEPF